jgi:hypothetical protein
LKPKKVWIEIGIVKQAIFIGVKWKIIQDSIPPAPGIIGGRALHLYICALPCLVLHIVIRK